MPVDTTTNSSVRVEIFDQAYNLRGSDPEYILRLAAHVDAKMRAVADATHTVDSGRLAVLAALNIADDYHQLKIRLDDEESRERSANPLSEEERQRNRERRRRHYTKRSYEKQLLALVNDESIPTKERRGALLALGRSRGYLRAPKAKT